MQTSETYMIGWRARAHQQGDFVLLLTCQTNGVTPEHAGALGQRDRSPSQMAVSNATGRTAGPVDLREGVQLNRTIKDITVERQRLTGSAGEMEAGRRAGHGPDAVERWPG